MKARESQLAALRERYGYVLCEREKLILQTRKTTKEIAKELDLSVSRVNQIKRQAERQLHNQADQRRMLRDISLACKHLVPSPNIYSYGNYVAWKMSQALRSVESL